jgi:hypothetical protein
MILAVMAALVASVTLALLLRSFWIRSGLSVRQTVLSVGAALFIVLIVGLAATGRLNWIAAAFATAVPFAQRMGRFARLIPWIASLLPGLRGGLKRGSANSGSDSGSTTTESPFFRMTLHHASGHIDGEIKQGRHRARFLSELTFAELVGLLGEVPDYDSQRLLETYLDHHYPDWRHSGQKTADAGGHDMSRSEALEALGLADGASRNEIVSAHRRLIQKLHPDRGGSTYLAALLNRAKDILIKDH